MPLLPPGPPLPLTPSAFLEAVASRLDRLHGGDAAPVLLRAVPVKTSSNPRVYSGFIYAELKDPRTTEALSARVPEQLAPDLEWGREAVFVGLLRFTVRRGQLKPEFRIDSVHEAGALRLLARDELIERWSAAIARPKQDVREALAGERPRVVLITGVGSVAADDVRATPGGGGRVRRRLAR